MLYPCNISHFRFFPVNFFYSPPIKENCFGIPVIGHSKTNFFFVQKFPFLNDLLMGYSKTIFFLHEGK